MLGESLEFCCEDVGFVRVIRLARFVMFKLVLKLRWARTTAEAFSVSRVAAEERESWECVFWRSAGKNEGQPFQP